MMWATIFICAAAAAPAPAAKAEWIKGRVERVGTVQTPQLNLISEDGKRFELAGALVTELSSLEGAKLDVQIEREHEGSMLPRVKALAYQIDDIGGGDKPEIGIVKIEGEQVSVVIDKDKTLKLADTQVARHLRGKDGAKVWVVGKSTSNGFKAWRVGFLLPAKNPTMPPPVKED
jgi:hypothetical protein